MTFFEPQYSIDPGMEQPLEGLATLGEKPRGASMGMKGLQGKGGPEITDVPAESSQPQAEFGHINEP